MHVTINGLTHEVGSLRRRWLERTLAFAFLGCLQACGTNQAGARDGSTDSDDKPVGKQYVVASRITLPSGTSTLITSMDSLEPRALDTPRGLEVPGFGAAHASSEIPGAIFVADGERPEFTRYALEASGTFSRGATLSFGQHGLSRAPRTVVFASATRAYAIAPESYRIFVWNPEQMTLDAALDLSLLRREGFTPAWVFQAVVQGDRLLVPIAWFKSGADPAAALDSAILSLDMRSHELALEAEGRCGGLRSIFRGGAGDVYFSSSAGAPATWHRLYGDKAGSKPCLLRIRAGEAATDSSFFIDAAQLSPHSVAVDFSPAGPSHLIFQVLDETRFAITPRTTAEELWNAAVWQFWSVPIAALETAATQSAEPLSLEPSALNALRFEVDGKYFVPQIRADYSETTLVDVTDPTVLAQGPTIRGSVGSFLRVR